MSNVMEFYGFQFSSKAHASPQLSHSQKCFKGTLLMVNLLFMIFGIVLAAVGSYALTGRVNELSGESLPRGIIVIGVFIMIISLLGCISAWKESRIFLGVYFVFLLIFTIILFSVGIAVYVKKDQSQEYMEEGWKELDSPSVDPAVKQAVRSGLQEAFTCCGLYYYNDTLSAQPCPATSTTTRAACLPLLQSNFEKSFTTAGGCGIGFSVVMVLGMVLVCVLMEGIKQKKHLEDIRKLHKKIKDAKENDADGAAAQAGEDQAMVDDNSV